MTKLQMWELKQRQGLPLEAKIIMSQDRIRQFYNHYDGKVYVAFSGGKDSTAMLHLVRSIYPEVEGVFVDTGLEYPEIKEFVKTIPNITILKPKMSFRQVLDKYGYPVISKKVARQVSVLRNPRPTNQNSRTLYDTGIKQDGSKSKNFKLSAKWRYLIQAPFNISEKCCDILKKDPIHEYQKQSKKFGFIGQMASDSNGRESVYLQTGCNNWKKNISTPIAFWTEQDIWDYIHKFNLKYCPIYDTGIKRTGCIFCMFGVHLEKRPNRFERMKQSHPQLYRYCMNQLGLDHILDYIHVEYGSQTELK